MSKKAGFFVRKKIYIILFAGAVLGIGLTILSNKAIEATSTNESCKICHVHPHVFDSWKLSVHHDTRSGVQIGCVECHLPPKGHGYLKEKIKASARDAYGYIFKDSADFNWEAKSTLEEARHHTFDISCKNCHKNLFPLTLTKKGQDAHLYYSRNEKDLLCINCHIDAGHYNPNIKHAQNIEFGKTGNENQKKYDSATVVLKHEDFTEKIPGTTISFNMKAIPGGTFKIGSPESEQFRKPDEGPQKDVKISPFFMAEIEVSWNEYLAFYGATAAEGRSTDTEGVRKTGDVDAISGPTPPYGQPDQNWGLGMRPAITMSFQSAETYVKWLSKVTGKNYRLPTEAEWEYAARGGKETPFFFDGQPKDFSEKGFPANLFGKSSTEINNYVVYGKNSQSKTAEPEKVKANPYGLKNMLGNVAEYCADWYDKDAYSRLENGATDPRGPETGDERVIRGGYFKSDVGDVRSASRDYTKTEAWLKTDPQMPKSVWWLSDCNFIGFRVVCDFDEKTGNN
jgi:formylglycine-generating enzyme required for sulfatase activity